ncbi:LOB domain-containing protein [Salix suchowensis]|nr:LOB domain-containing protein [Salix suchowensis]
MLKLPFPILSKNPDILTTKLTHQASEVSIKPPPPDFDFRTGIMDTSSEVLSCKCLQVSEKEIIHGACNVAKMLQQLPAAHLRAEAANSLYYEAQCRTRDPVYGCVGIISSLHQQIHSVESQLAKTKAEIAVLDSLAQQPAQIQ